MSQTEPVRRTRREASSHKAWIDVGKGTAMVLVVLLHSAAWIETQFNDGAPTFWFLFSEFFRPIRMPIFFFISGYLAASALKRPLGSSKARTLGFFYIYAFWTILFVARLWLPVPGYGNDAPDLLLAVLAVLLPTSFWYLWALAVFFLVAWIARSLLGERAIWLLIPVAALALGGGIIDSAEASVLVAPLDTLKFGELAQNFVWFYAGLYLGPLWGRLMARSSVLWTGIGAVAYTAAFMGVAQVGWLSEARPVLALGGLVLSALVLSVLPLDGVVGRAFQRVGRSTLPVYIFHIFLISALSAIVKLVGLDGVIAGDVALWGVLLPPVIAAALIPLCMAVGAVVLRSPLRWTLSPDWLRGR